MVTGTEAESPGVGAERIVTTDIFEWLPALIPFSDYDGQWPKYCEAIYSMFHRDFIASKPAYPSKRFATKRHPEYDGKAATFWHLISEGNVEDDRLPDLRRCERIAWPKPIIEAMNTVAIRFWKNTRGRNVRILLAVEDFSYVVVLEEREDFVLLWTAYFVEYPNKRRRMQQEYEAWKETNRP